MIKRNKTGIGLLELMLSLAIIAVILVLATRYYQVTRSSQAVNEASGMVLGVYAAGSSWLDSHDNFDAADMIPKFVDNMLLPADFKKGNANPWGGEIQAMGSADDPTQLTIILDNVPQADCKNLAARVSQKLNVISADCGPEDTTTFTAVFELGE